MTDFTPASAVLGPARTRRGMTMRGFSQLSLTNWRELWRDPKTLFFSMIFPFMFLGMFGLMGTLIDASGAAPKVAVTGPQAQAVTAELVDRGIAVVPGAAGGAANVVVAAQAGRAKVVVDVGDRPSKNGVLTAVGATGVSKSDITVLDSDGNTVFDPLKGSLPTVLMLALLSLAFLGTAAPLVGLRQRGTLRLLGTTPLRRGTFILAQSPARFVMGAVQAALIAGYAYYLGYLDLAAAGTLLVTCLLGLVMLLALGYLLASRISNQDLVTTIASLLIPVALLLAGGMLPPQLLPDGVRLVSEKLPTTILANALGVDLVGTDPGVALPVLWAMMAAIAVVAGGAAALLFKWDQGEKR